MGCVFYFISRHSSGIGCPDCPFSSDESDTTTNYITCVYWALATIGTVGYGDIYPKHNSEKIFTISVMLFGSIVYASIFGNINALLQSFDKAKSRYTDRIASINEFCAINQIDANRKFRLMERVEAMWAIRKGIDIADILDGLPSFVKTDLLMFMYEDLFKQVPFFRRCGRDFLEQVVKRLEVQVYMRGDVLLRQGDIGDRMWFVQKGELVVLDVAADPDSPYEPLIPDEEDERVATLGPGSFVGENALVEGVRSSCTVVAIEKAKVAALRKTCLDKIIAIFPETVILLKEYAERRTQMSVIKEQLRRQQMKQRTPKPRRVSLSSYFQRKSSGDDGTPKKKRRRPAATLVGQQSGVRSYALRQEEFTAARVIQHFWQVAFMRKEAYRTQKPLRPVFCMALSFKGTELMTTFRMARSAAQRERQMNSDFMEDTLQSSLAPSRYRKSASAAKPIDATASPTPLNGPPLVTSPTDTTASLTDIPVPEGPTTAPTTADQSTPFANAVHMEEVESFLVTVTQQLTQLSRSVTDMCARVDKLEAVEAKSRRSSDAQIDI